MITRKEFIVYSAISFGTLVANQGFINTAFADIVNDSVFSDREASPIERDSFNRVFSVQNIPSTVFPLGFYAQSVIYALAPEKLIRSTIFLEERQRIDFIGNTAQGTERLSKSNSVSSELSSLNADLIIDIGSAAKSSPFSLSTIENTTSSTCVFFDGSFEGLSSTLSLIGRVLNAAGYEKRVAYVNEVTALVLSKSKACNNENPLNVYIATAEIGNRTATYHYLQDNVLQYLNINCMNNTLVSDAEPKDELVGIIDINEIAKINPDFIVFRDVKRAEADNPNSAFCHIWRNFLHLENSKAIFVPITEFSWLSSPLISQCLGILWLGITLRPEIYSDVNIYDYAIRFYELFVRCAITSAELEEALGAEEGMQ